MHFLSCSQTSKLGHRLKLEKAWDMLKNDIELGHANAQLVELPKMLLV